MKSGVFFFISEYSEYFRTGKSFVCQPRSILDIIESEIVKDRHVTGRFMLSILFLPFPYKFPSKKCPQLSAVILIL